MKNDKTHEKPRGKRGAAYIRVSAGEEQNPESQRKKVRDWLARLGLPDLTAWYEDVEGRNSRDLAFKRKDFQRLITDVELGLYDYVVVAEDDRFGMKNNNERGYYLHRITSSDCELWSVDEGCLSRSDAVSVIQSSVNSVASQAELFNDGKRVIRGKRESTSKGLWQGGFVPFGFDVICINEQTRVEQFRVIILRMDRESGVYQRLARYKDGREERVDGINRFPRKQDWEQFYLAPSIMGERVKQAKQIFSMFASGAWSINGLCTKLNELQIDPVNGSGWYPTRLKPLLMNPLYYVGATVYNKRSHGKNAWFSNGETIQAPWANGKPITGRANPVADQVFPTTKHEGLITKELFDEVQERLKGIKGPQKGLKDDSLWLAGLVYCGSCKKRMSGRAQHGSAYVCTSYAKFGKSSGCRLHRTDHGKIEKYLLQYLDQLQPELKALLKTQGQPDLLGQMHQDLADKEQELFGVFNSMKEFLLSQGIKIDQEGLDVVQSYEQFFAQKREGLESELAEQQAALRGAMMRLNRLPDGSEAFEMQLSLISGLDSQIKRIKAQLAPLTQRLDHIYADLQRLDSRLDDARTALKGHESRHKANMVRKVIERIELHHVHYDQICKDKRSKNSIQERSTLDKITFYPVVGHTFTIDNQKEPG